MSAEGTKQPKRKYERPRLTVHGTVKQITQTSAAPYRNERNPIFPGSNLRGPY